MSRCPVCLVCPVVCSAQAGVWDDATKGVLALLGPLASLLSVVLGLAGVVALAAVVIKLIDGDRESATRLAWWAAGLTVGFVLLTVVENLVKGI